MGDGTRGDIYKEGVDRMDEIYNIFIREWGQVDGDAIVEARTTEPLNTLIALNVWMMFLHKTAIRDIIQRFQNSMNNENSTLRTAGLGPLRINLLAVGKDMCTALYTQRYVMSNVVSLKVEWS